MMTVKELVFGSDELTPKQENLRQLIMYPFAGVFTALANFVSFVIMDLIITESIDIEPSDQAAGVMGSHHSYGSLHQPSVRFQITRQLFP